MKIRKRFLIPTLVLVMAILGGVFSFFWWNESIKPLTIDSSPKNFVIQKGSSASEIANKLQKEGFIKSALAFKIYIQITNRSKKILSGEYRLPQNLSLSELVNKLEKGPDEIWTTIPEGLRREEVVERFIKAFELNILEADKFRKEFLEISKDNEGYLFPDTYLFPKTASPSGVIKKMVSTFENKIGINVERNVVILASLVERETKTSEERPTVAGILLKRLKVGWPLQVDASLQYAVADTNLSKYWLPLTKKDLEIDSPYNTYKFKGLPPTPIANPGLSSIRAAQEPEDSPYWFYLHDPQGKIHFAKTIEEHNQNIRNYLGK